VFYDRETGQLLTGSLLDYTVPRADSLPAFRSQFQETPSPTNRSGEGAQSRANWTPV